MQGVPPGPVQVGLANYDPPTDESETEAAPSPDDATRLVMDTLEATAVGPSAGGDKGSLTLRNQRLDGPEGASKLQSFRWKKLSHEQKEISALWNAAQTLGG